MATLIISSPNEEVTNFLEMYVEEPKITKAYWTNSNTDEPAEWIVPEVKYILTINLEGYARKDELEVTIKNTEAPELSKIGDIVIKAKVNKDQKTATVEHKWKWDEGGVFETSIKGKLSNKDNSCETKPLKRRCGIWIEYRGRKEPHWFDRDKAQRHKGNIHPYVRAVYDSYHYLNDKGVAKVFNAFLDDPLTDIAVGDRNTHFAIFDENTDYKKDIDKIQKIGKVFWIPSWGAVLDDGTRQCPALLLLHEFGHAYDVKTYGMEDYKKLFNNKSTRPEVMAGSKDDWDAFLNQREYSNIIYNETPAAKVLEQGVRPKYEFAKLHKMVNVDSTVLTSEIKNEK